MIETKEVVIRDAETPDVEAIADLALRLKRLNGEFDPMFQVRDDAKDQLIEYLTEAIESSENVVLTAAAGDKIVGMVKADLIDRLFYVPKMKGEIVEFYVLPEYRRSGVGEEILDQVVKKLNQAGADIIAAEFPAQNKIAVSFYEKEGFRALESVWARTV